jgi:hypothetical protein
MGVRLVESIKLESSCRSTRWDFSLAGAAVLFDGEGFAVSCDDYQPDGPQFTWADIAPDTTTPEPWHGPRGDELLEAQARSWSHLAAAL